MNTHFNVPIFSNQFNNLNTQRLNYYPNETINSHFLPNLLKLQRNLNCLNPFSQIEFPNRQNINFPSFQKNSSYSDLDSELGLESNSDFQYSNRESNASSENTKESSDKNSIGKKAGSTNDFKTKWKTEKCRYWEMYGECKFGNNCAFAHGGYELKQKLNLNENYKTKPCKQFFEEGFCNYGSRCQFSHKKEVYENYHNIKHEYQINKYNEIVHDLLTKGSADINSVTRPRLLAFTEIVEQSSYEVIANRLLFYQDILDIKKIMEMNQKIGSSFLLRKR